MKKLMLLPLLASAGLLFCSCGKQTAETVSASAENTSENTESQNSVTDTNNGSVPEQTVTEEPEEITEEEPFYYYEGDYLIFGTYEQDGVYSNGPEPIEWMILEENENGTLLLSRYVLEVKPYNEERGNTEWETCTLRKWLNDDFCHEAFTDDQIALINDTTLKNPDNLVYHNYSDYNDTVDKIFLLGYDELVRCFEFNSWDEDYLTGFCQQLAANPTDYCKDNDIHFLYVTRSDYTGYLKEKNYTEDFIGFEGATWWLRQTGSTPVDACYVTKEGIAGMDNFYYADDETMGVRPVLYIHLDQ